MPRQRVNHSRGIYVVPDDLPDRLERFKEESGLTWAEIARHLGVDPLTVRRWWKYGSRPNPRHMMALLDLAGDLGLGHLFTAWSIGDWMSGPGRRGRSSGMAIKPAPGRCRNAKGKSRQSARGCRPGPESAKKVSNSVLHGLVNGRFRERETDPHT